jgi:hypothetical protein
MTTKTAKKKAEEVGVMFKAPQEIRGCIRTISAWAEMNDVRFDGKIPLEKDIWAWIAASLYSTGESGWKDSLEEGRSAFKKMTERAKAN